MKLITTALALLSSVAFATDLPSFDKDTAAHAWLLKNSRTFAASAAKLEKSGGVKFTFGTSTLNGNYYDDDGHRCIGIPESIKGAERLNRIAFHVVNAANDSRVKAIDAAAAAGKITTAESFADQQFAVYYDSHLALYKILSELDASNNGLPKEALQFWGQAANSFDELAMPTKAQLKKAQASTYEHFADWFKKQKDAK